MKKLLIGWMLFAATAFLVGQTQPQDSASATKPSAAYTGMYSFLRDGEFVQVSVEDTGKVNGFVSRYGDLDSDRGAFLNQFFKEGKLDGKNLTFTTETVHGVWYELGKVNGFVSRYGDLDSDRGAFLNQFFKEGKLDGKNLTFTTETVHGVWY